MKDTFDDEIRASMKSPANTSKSKGKFPPKKGKKKKSFPPQQQNEDDAKRPMPPQFRKGA